MLRSVRHLCRPFTNAPLLRQAWQRPSVIIRTLQLGLAAGILGAMLLPDASAFQNATNPSQKSAGGTSQPDESALSLESARERARLLHDIYATTLDVMHHRYFHGDRDIVPALAMKDIFSRMQRKSKATVKWISVNAHPMNIDHEPQTAFEKRAASAIEAGKREFESVEEGVYRRAGAISLNGSCLKCHTTTSVTMNSAGAARFAGLVVSVPITAEK